MNTSSPTKRFLEGIFIWLFKWPFVPAFGIALLSIVWIPSQSALAQDYRDSATIVWLFFSGVLSIPCVLGFMNNLGMVELKQRTRYYIIETVFKVFCAVCFASLFCLFIVSESIAVLSFMEPLFQIITAILGCLFFFNKETLKTNEP